MHKYECHKSPVEDLVMQLLMKISSLKELQPYLLQCTETKQYKYQCVDSDHDTLCFCRKMNALSPPFNKNVCVRVCVYETITKLYKDGVIFECVLVENDALT